MKINTGTGLLQEARQCPSPNQDARPADCLPTLIVIHNISLPPDQFGGPWIDDLFLNGLDPAADPYFTGICHLRVSSHLLIRRDGEVVQYVPFHRKAFHAGISRYQGREACNDFSIGIEVEGSDHVPFSDVQYAVLIRVIRALCAAYSTLTFQHVTGHQHIAPGRKTDPGPFFDWEQLGCALGATLPADTGAFCGGPDTGGVRK
ncbi:MAG TPA: 1,6-anhydro-N-acetylmuramyl-L-alanine amidase AmpD [Thiolinea sp.]|nr:1,6-anhydro-N-acetylmuramyl-L-alanine amidase AmpD [Thiolinea sp.]